VHSTHKILLVMLTGLFGILSLAAAPAAQARSGRPTIRCESIHGKFNRCAMPWRNAELVRQESKGACNRGQSWGVDRQGLWVNHGCRGLFAQARGGHGGQHGGGRPNPGWDRSITLECGSSRQRYNFCQVDVGRHGRVRLTRRISDSRCVEGSSWGWNRAGVWVNHGCRARFVVDRRW
jgi:hypothetical protein